MTVEKGNVGVVIFADHLKLLVDLGLSENLGAVGQVTHVLDSQDAFVNHRLDELKQVGVLDGFVIRRDGTEAFAVVIANNSDTLIPALQLTGVAHEAKGTVGDGPVKVVGNSESRHSSLFVVV